MDKDLEVYNRYITELINEIEGLKLKLSLVSQVLVEIRDRDNSHFSKIAEAVLSEIKAES